VHDPRAMLEGVLALSATAMLMLGIGGLADGADFARHLYLFNACLDLLLFVMLVRLFGGLPKRMDGLRDGGFFPLDTDRVKVNQ